MLLRWGGKWHMHMAHEISNISFSQHNSDGFREKMREKEREREIEDNKTNT